MEDLEQFKDIFESALIPKVYRNKKLSGVQPGGSELTKIFFSENFKSEHSQGIGANLWSGNVDARVQLFPLFARTVAMQYTYALFVDSHVLYQMCIERDHYLRERMYAPFDLCVEGFCPNDYEFPYTKSDRRAMENYLSWRAKQGYVNYYCSSHTLRQCTSWWSEEFVSAQSKFCRDIEIG